MKSGVELKCCVIGLGYIGLPTAAVIANAGHKVVGVDVNEKINKWKIIKVYKFKNE